MFNTFNMGVGMCCTVDKNDADRRWPILRDNGEEAYVMGEIVRGGEGVELC
jgi:phosphoribosylformylglycinamidine cyclo-ligase